MAVCERCFVLCFRGEKGDSGGCRTASHLCQLRPLLARHCCSSFQRSCGAGTSGVGLCVSRGTFQ